MEISQRRREIVLVALLILAAAPYFLSLGASSLWDSNEAFYAETPREMIESGDYLNPSFNYQPRFNKPPLCYWVVAIFYKLFGVSELSERLPIAIGAMVLITTAFALARILFSLEAGLLAAIVMAATPRFLMFSRRIIIDVYIAMFMGLTLLFFILAELRPDKRRLYLSLMYVSVGLGILTKGPVALLLPALAFVIYLAINKRLSRVREMMLPAGMLIIGAIVIPWYAAIYFQHGWRYIAAFIFKDNISRFTEPIWGPSRGFLFYVPVAIGDFFPWSIFLIAAIILAIRRIVRRPGDERAGDSKARTLVVVWIIVIISFFTLSRSKEDLYILPAYAAAAAITGGLLARGQPHAALRWASVVIGGAVFLMGAAAIYLSGESAQIHKLAGAVALGAIAIAGGAITTVAALLKKQWAAVTFIALTIIALNWVFVLRLLPDFERYKPVPRLGAVIANNAAPDALVGYFRFTAPSMVFYLRRPIFEYFRLEELQAAFASGKEVYCLMSEKDYETIKQSMPVATSVLASHPVFQVKLKSILDSNELPQVVLITNKYGVGNSQ